MTKVLLLAASAAHVTQLRKLVLEKGGYEVLIAFSPGDAARVAREPSVRIAVVDCEEENAAECCVAIRAANKDIPLVGLGQNYFYKQLQPLLHAYVHKLDGPHALLQTISNLLERAPHS